MLDVVPGGLENLRFREAGGLPPVSVVLAIIGPGGRIAPTGAARPSIPTDGSASAFETRAGARVEVVTAGSPLLPRRRTSLPRMALEQPGAGGGRGWLGWR